MRKAAEYSDHQDAGQLQPRHVWGLVRQQLALDVTRNAELAFECVAFPEDAVRRLYLPAHPVVDAEGHRDQPREHGVPREDQQADSKLRQEIQRLDQHGHNRPEQNLGQQDQRVEQQAQCEWQPGEERKDEPRRHLRAVADDLGEQEAQAQDRAELDASSKRDPDRNSDADHSPGRRPPYEKPPARCQDRVGRGGHRSGWLRVRR